MELEFFRPAPKFSFKKKTAAAPATKKSKKSKWKPSKAVTEVIEEYQAVYAKALTEHTASKADLGRIKYLRPSQLPFCPAAFFVAIANSGLYRTLDMMGDFYTNIGTVVHSVAQKYLGRSGKYLANWKCKVCKSVYKATFKNTCCDTPMWYDEIDIDYKGIKGHIDAVYRDKKKRYWIKDFKTTSLEASPKKLEDPGMSYVEQIETYAWALWKQYGIKVHGVLLAFIPRDNPKEQIVWGKELTDADFERIGKRLKLNKRQHKEVLAVSSKAEALALLAYGKCVDPWCDVCRHPKAKRKEIMAAAYKRGKAFKRLPINDMLDRAYAELKTQNSK